MANQCYWYNPTCWLDSLIESLKDLFLYIWDLFLSGLASLIEAIPTPSFLMDLTGLELPETVIWLASMFQLDFGLTVITSAYTFRFILRRIPGVG